MSVRQEDRDLWVWSCIWGHSGWATSEELATANFLSHDCASS